MTKAMRRWLSYVDIPLFGLFLLILTAGLFILSTAAYALVADDPYHYVKSHGLWIVSGVPLALAAACIDYKHIRYACWFLYGFVVLLLLVVEFLGFVARGSQRWLEVADGVAVQPSEFAKIIVIVALACLLSKRPKGLKRFRNFLLPFLVVALPMVLIFAQPDFGTALVFMAIFIGMMFVAGAHPIKFGGLLLAATGSVVAALFLHLSSAESLPAFLRPLAGLPLPLKDYQLNRILAFLQPVSDASGDGYQVMQSVWAIGSGGLWGKGYHMGTQGQHNFIPDHHTDFIFSILGEEFGFFGATILLLLFCAFILRCVSVAVKARDMLGSLIVAGLVSMWVFQFFVNVGMASGIMPVTGLPLPFITPGGSSMWANLMGMGLVFGVYARRERAMF